MNPNLISVLSAMTAAVWSMWTWRSERQKERDLKRNEMSAQYVNNMIVATQELQRKLFKILEEDELALYRSKYSEPIEPATPVAIDLLFHLSAFFGWSNLTFRFGPYTRDSRMIAMMAQIADVMDTRKHYPGDAFRFSLTDRHALGHAAVERVGETASGPGFSSISRFKFEEKMQGEGSEWCALFRSEDVQCTLTAIDRAVRGEPLEGRERLAVLQNLLVDLLAYLEEEEGFAVTFGKRGRAKVENKQSGVFNCKSRDISILHQMPGRIRLKISSLNCDHAYAQHVQSLLQALDYVKDVRVNIDAASVVVEYLQSVPQEDLIAAIVATIENDLHGTAGGKNVLQSRAVSLSQARSRVRT